MAMAFVLLIGAGLMIRTLLQLWRVDPGFDPHNVVSFGIHSAPSLAEQSFGVTPTDPLTFAAVAVVLCGIGLCACYVPIHRAMRVDPILALRQE
jgi:ABC-type lipoprotein release transport system permease subunit